eukprot:scaffold130698_cov57-Phaeocystis_antarctica.AAC.4
MMCSSLLALSAALVMPPPTRPPFGDPLGLRRSAPAALPLPGLRGAAAAALPLFGGAAAARADVFSGLDASLDPRNFQPVCPASDGVYRFGKVLILGLVGPESVK